MDYLKKAVWGPDPKEQFRKCQSTIRKNKRQMERQIQDLNGIEKKSKNLIKQALKKSDLKTAKRYAKEYRNTQLANQRMHVSKATLDSIEMKLNEQQQLIKIKGSMQKSTAIMKDMNKLVRLPEISRTVQELSKELTKSGVIDEMVTDMIDSAELDDEDLDESEEIDEILKNILGEDKSKNTLEESSNKLSEAMPETIHSPVVETEPGQPIEEDDDEMLQNMRLRLNALQE